MESLVFQICDRYLLGKYTFAFPVWRDKQKDILKKIIKENSKDGIWELLN